MWTCTTVDISPKSTLRSARRAVAKVRGDKKPTLATFVNKRNGNTETVFSLPPGYTASIREQNKTVVDGVDAA